mgnify:CR=1 FL=1
MPFTCQISRVRPLRLERGTTATGISAWAHSHTLAKNAAQITRVGEATAASEVLKRAGVMDQQFADSMQALPVAVGHWGGAVAPTECSDQAIKVAGEVTSEITDSQTWRCAARG